jgi:dihydropyrimidinase
VIDYSFHPTISGQYFNDSMLDELQDLVEKEGITSIKMFMAYKGKSMVNDAMMYKVMKKAGELGIISNVHAENGDVIDEMVKESLKKGNIEPIYHAYTRSPIVEAEATARALAIAEAADAPFISYMSVVQRHWNM